MKNIKNDQNAVFGIKFTSPLAALGMLLLGVTTIGMYGYTTGLQTDVGFIGDIVNAIHDLSVFFIGFGVALVLTQLTWDYRWILPPALIIGVVYYIFIFTKIGV
jgi:hypothetical protein